MQWDIYIERDTPVHRLDPRTKILLMLCSFFALCLFQNPHWVLGLAVAVVLHGIWARALPNLAHIRYILVILAVSSLILWNLFTRGVTPLCGFVTVESLRYSIGRTLMMLATAVAGVTFLSTTRNEEMVVGLIRMGLPYRVGFAISAAMRMVPTIVGATAQVMQAQRSRGHDIDRGNVIRRIRNYAPLLIPVFISAIRTTHVLSMALESRAFGARKDRTYYLDPRMRTADYVVLVLTGAALVALTWLRIRGYGLIPGLIKR